jgi:hypothetical protein
MAKKKAIQTGKWDSCFYRKLGLRGKKKWLKKAIQTRKLGFLVSIGLFDLK